MSNTNKEFYDLLEQIINEQAFDLELTNGKIVKCKPLTTSQLTDLIKTNTYTPITQAFFNNASNKVFEESVIGLPNDYKPNIIDRLLFLLETRIRSISSTITLTNSDEETEIVVDLITLKNNIVSAYKQNKSFFDKQTLTDGKISLTVEIPLIKTDQQLNEEIYNTLDVNADNIKDVISDLFINELTKHISSVTLNGTFTQNFDNTETFEERAAVLRSLPTALTQKLVSYIEKQKQLIEDNFLVDGLFLSIDSSFFTVS